MGHYAAAIVWVGSNYSGSGLTVQGRFQIKNFFVFSRKLFMEVEFGKILENCFIAFEPGSERSYPSYHAHSNGKLCTGKSAAFLSI